MKKVLLPLGLNQCCFSIVFQYSEQWFNIVSQLGHSLSDSQGDICLGVNKKREKHQSERSFYCIVQLRHKA